VKYSLSIRFMWTEVPMPERARRAAAHGFDRVELWDWRGEPIDEVARACSESGIEIAGFFGHSYGALCDPAQHDRVLEALSESVEVARRVGATQLHMFSDDRLPQGGFAPSPPLTAAAKRRACVEGLRRCAELVEGNSVELTLEAINTVFVPGYFLSDFGAALEIVREVDHPQVRIFFDCFHQQLVGGRLIENLRDGLPWVTSVHVADVPGRRQPGTGEINFHAIRRVLEEAAYDRQITFEIDPLDGDSDAAIASCKEVFSF
jgi:hydroxypyruvate isomerase